MANWQRPGVLRCLPGSVVLPGGIGGHCIPIQELNLPVWKVIDAVVVLASISAGALAGWRRYPYLLIGWLWYLGMLVPVIGVVQLGGHAVADRFTYLPQIGLCIALAVGSGGHVPVLAVSSLGVRRHVGIGVGSPDELCVASDIFLVQQRDPLGSHPGLYFAKLCGPHQPWQRLGRPRADSTRR